jgi:hypothetical protein
LPDNSILSSELLGLLTIFLNIGAFCRTQRREYFSQNIFYARGWVFGYLRNECLIPHLACLQFRFDLRINKQVSVGKITKVSHSTVFRIEERKHLYMRFEVFTAVKMKIWRWRQYVPPKCWYLPTSPHGVTTRKNTIDGNILTFVETESHITVGLPERRQFFRMKTVCMLVELDCGTSEPFWLLPFILRWTFQKWNHHFPLGNAIVSCPVLYCTDKPERVIGGTVLKT